MNNTNQCQCNENQTKLENTENTENNDLNTFLQDNSGGLSSIRLMLCLWVGGVFLIWAFASIFAIKNGATLPSLPSEIVTILLGITGIKCVQRFGEKP